MKKEKAKRERFSLAETMRKAYQTGQEDENLAPVIRVNKSGRAIGRLHEGDSVIFYDIRGEREVELTQSLTDENFHHFPRKQNLTLNFVTMIEYTPGLKVRVAFPSDERIRHTLTEVLSEARVKIVKIAESEKAHHIGFFMNGKNDKIFPGEKRMIIPSPQGLASYAQNPELSIKLVSQEISSQLKDPTCQVIIANLANVDVIGHIENKSAAIEAVEAVDRELGKIFENSCSQGVTLLVTSDHGTVEEWLYPDGMVNTGHTKNPVPFILADFSLTEPQSLVLKEEGELADVAPTLLELLGLPTPSEMTGKSLLEDNSQKAKARRRILLLILDGWGLREEKRGNLIAEAWTPNFDRLWEHFPHAVLKASGEAVGMPSHTVGNSEAGHLHLGAGRRILLDRVRIDKAIEDGSFFQNEDFLWAVREAKRIINLFISWELFPIIAHMEL